MVIGHKNVLWLITVMAYLHCRIPISILIRNAAQWLHFHEELFFHTARSQCTF